MNNKLKAYQLLSANTKMKMSLKIKLKQDVFMKQHAPEGSSGFESAWPKAYAYQRWTLYLV